MNGIIKNAGGTMLIAVMAGIQTVGCGTHDYSNINPIPLAIEALDEPATPPSGGGNMGKPGIKPVTASFIDGNLGKGIPISLLSSFQVATGLTIATDYYGDGIANDVESRPGSNPFGCVYPRVTIQTHDGREFFFIEITNFLSLFAAHRRLKASVIIQA